MSLACVTPTGCPLAPVAEPNFFFWEPIVLLERIVLVGFVQWIPSRLALLRLLLGQVVVLVYSTLLMFLRPYKRQVCRARGGG